MATTPNLGLPLIDGAMTADVPRDMNALANAVDTAVSNVSIPDASLTVKGKVRLSNSTNGTSEALAPTEKALGVVMATALSAVGIINDREGYGTTSNSGNTYAVTLTPAPTAYVDGLRITIKINAANTGAATINVNGLGAKAILKSNGGAMTTNSLRVNSVYSLVYNGTSFILQGEGGEYGSAVAGDVRLGKTIGTDNGLVTGSLAERSTTSITPSSDVQNFPAGIYPEFNVQAQTPMTYRGVVSAPAFSTRNVPVPFQAVLGTCREGTNNDSVSLAVVGVSYGGFGNGSSATVNNNGFIISFSATGQLTVTNQRSSGSISLDVIAR